MYTCPLAHPLTHSLHLSLTDNLHVCCTCAVSLTSCLNHHDWDSDDRLSNQWYMYALCDSKHHTRPLTHYSLTHSLTHSLPLSLTDIITTCLLYMCCLTVTSCLNHHDWDSHDVGYYRLSNVTQNILPTHSLPHYLTHFTTLTYLLTHPLTHLITCIIKLTCHCLSVHTHSLTASSHIHRYRLHVLLIHCDARNSHMHINQVMITSAGAVTGYPVLNHWRQWL